MIKLIVDLRSREEYYQSHTKGSLNIPVSDLAYYIDFLKDKDILLYCDTGKRAKIALDHLARRAIKATIISQEAFNRYEKEGNPILCAINYLSVKPGVEQEFEKKTKELCRITYDKKGFLGSKIFRVSTISYGGSGLQGQYENIDVNPTKYVMLTYWASKQAHEEFHKEPDILKGFMGLRECARIELRRQ